MNFGILRAFLQDQRRAKRLVSERLGVSEDILAVDWALQHLELFEAYRKAPFAKIFRPHGYGLELKLNDLHIDYDYSREGRRDGFDAWRLFVYMKKGRFDNRGPDRLVCYRVEDWVNGLCESGRAIHPDNLCYLVEGAVLED